MCGRFALIAESAAVAELFETPAVESAPRYNIAPTQPILAARLDTRRERELTLLRWGLVPSWSNDPAAGVKAFNARAETLAEKPTFRAAFKSRRCLIPASGFYEWQKAGKTKQPFFIHPARGGLFAFAGLWETWSKAGEPVNSCTIITTAANETMTPYHERMPVILPPAAFAAWLDPLTPSPAVANLLQPYPGEWLDVHPVSAAVGNVRNDGPHLLAPLNQLFPA